jgi:hypothetical protein
MAIERQKETDSTVTRETRTSAAALRRSEALAQRFGFGKFGVGKFSRKAITRRKDL